MPVGMSDPLALETETLDVYAIRLISFKTTPEVAVFKFSCTMFLCEESISKSGLVCHGDHMWQQFEQSLKQTSLVPVGSVATCPAPLQV